MKNKFLHLSLAIRTGARSNTGSSPLYVNISSILLPASPQLGSWGSFSQRINKALALTTGITLSSPRRTDISHFTHTFLDPLVVSGNGRDVKTLAMKTSPVGDGFWNSTLKYFVSGYRVKAPRLQYSMQPSSTSAASMPPCTKPA